MTVEGAGVDESGEQEDLRARRRRDIWQLHIPLVVVLTLCAVITIIEVRRAGDGVWRAWIYMFEWPLIALFAVWVWHRYRTKGSLFKGLQEQWQRRIEQLGAQADAAEAMQQENARGAAARQQKAADPQLAAWREYEAGLDEGDPRNTPRS